MTIGSFTALEFSQILSLWWMGCDASIVSYSSEQVFTKPLLVAFNSMSFEYAAD